MARYNSYGALDDRMLEDLDSNFIGFNNRLRPDQLQKGILADSKNGRMDRNGEWQTRKGIENIIAPSSTGTAGLILPFDLDDSDPNSPALNDSATNAIYGSCVFSDPNDNSESYIILATNNKLLAYKVSNPSTVYSLNYPTNETINTPVELLQAFNEIYVFRGSSVAFVKDLSATNISTQPQLEKVTSGLFSQPTEIICEAGEFAIINNKGVVHKNPQDLDQGDTVSVVSDKLLSGDQHSAGLKIGEQFVVSKKFTAGSAKSITGVAIGAQETTGEYKDLYKITITASSHGFAVGDPVEIADIQTEHTGSKFVAGVPDGNTFFYYSTSSAAISDSTGSATLSAGFAFFIDSEKTDTHTTEGDTLTSTPVFTKSVSIGLGFTHMPAAEYGVYHQRRLAVPYRYSVDDAQDSYTDRKIFDEILLSDILDTNTYDQVYGQFRFNAGRSDFNVGMHSFSDDKLIVFNRNSIHIVLGSGDLKTSGSQLITDEVGLLARNSVVQVGNQVLFLSDNGIYGMNFIDLYNLRGNDVPLSEPINETLKDINKDHASKAVAAYFDNKYYIAIPTNTFADGSTNTAGINNKLLIYNFLNKSWESVDNVGSRDINNNTLTEFEFSNILVAGSGSKRAIYVTNKDGGVHRLEQHDDGIDRVITDIGGSEVQVRVEGSATTRMFNFGSIDRKKFNNFELHIQATETADSDAKLLTIGENVDTEPDKDLTPNGTLGTVFGPFKDSGGTDRNYIPQDEDVSIRGRLGNNRSYGLQFKLDSTLGRPRMRSIKVAACETYRSTSSVQ